MKLILGDCLEQLKSLPDNSVDSIVTDPPYGLSFMGKKWDYDVPSVDVWKECLRVLKHGGHALIACGTRTQHRMAVNIEDAGFEIRDVITWLYGSGFPKSLDISKAIDKAAGAEREVIGKKVSPYTSTGRNTNCYGEYDLPTDSKNYLQYNITSPSTDLAKQWQGWGTALKPACEFWTLARKPLSESTVAKNVIKHGVGGINIDGCRVEYSAEENIDFTKLQDGNIYGGNGIYGEATQKQTTPLFKPNGRFPANLILDEEAAALLDEQSGTSKSSTAHSRGKGIDGATFKTNNSLIGVRGVSDCGGASRFFYTAKASKSERNAGCEGLKKKSAGECTERVDGSAGLNSPRAGAGRTSGSSNHHPTVKPIKLMRYLCRLITPPNGTVLDPFMGSGSTGVAAKQEGFSFIGIEREAEYLKIAEARISCQTQIT